MESSRSVLFIENWLAEGEQIRATVINILWMFSSPYPVQQPIENYTTPTVPGSVMLTDKRLILIEAEWRGTNPNRKPRWYSSTGVVSLAERPPAWEKDWPYQAEVTLDSGVKVVFETERGQEGKASELSKLLTAALFSLRPNAKTNLFAQQSLEKQKEDERRRNND